jgi:Bacteriocin-protection, YdeI or OmpD-Associated
MLTKKLCLKPGARFVAVNAPEGFQRTLGKLPDGAKAETALKGSLDLVLLFVRDRQELKKQWTKSLPTLKQDGLLWVAYPKKSSGIDSDLAGMNNDWEVNAGSPWQPVSSISIDDTWSAVRFKYSPGLDEKRAQRQEELVHDADGTLCIDRNTRLVTAPKDLQSLLKKNAKAQAFFDSLSFTHKREYVEWIIGAKRPETRNDRRSQTIDKLMKGKRNPSEK